MSTSGLKQFHRTQRGALALAVSPGLLAAAVLVGFAGMAAAAVQSVPAGLALLVADVAVVLPVSIFALYLPVAIFVSRKLLPGKTRPATERLLRVLGAAGTFGFLLGGSCGWVSLAGYGLLPVDWAGNWPARIALVVLVWATVAVIATVWLAESGLRATTPKRKRKSTATRAAASTTAKSAPRKRAARHSDTNLPAGTTRTATV